MKSLSAIFLFIIWVLASAQGQKLMLPENCIGLKAGGGAGVFNSNLNTDYPFYFTEIKSAAAVFRTFESQRAALHLELGYAEKGGLNFYDRNFFTADTAGMPKVEYFVLNSRGIEFAALTHLAFGKHKSKFVMNFGPYAYYLYDKNLEPVESNEISRSLLPEKTYDFGIKAGIAYSLYLGKNIFELEVRYGHGFINVFEKDRINNALVNQNQTLMLNLLYFRKIKNKNI